MGTTYRTPLTKGPYPYKGVTKLSAAAYHQRSLTPGLSIADRKMAWVLTEA